MLFLIQMVMLMPNEIDLYWLRRHLIDEIQDRIYRSCTDFSSSSDFAKGIGLVLVSLTDLSGVNFGSELDLIIRKN